MTTIEIAASTAVNSDAVAAQLAEATPSAGPLDALAFERLSAAGQIDAVVAWERLVRHAHAGLIRCLGALARDEVGGPDLRLAETEVCAAMAWSPATAQTRLRDAEALTRLFPETLRQLSDGRVSLEQARALAELTCGLDDKAAQAVESRVLPRMAGHTVAATRQAIRRAVLHADPDAAAQRHRYERTRRRVELRPENDGMATLSFYLPAETAQMAMHTLTTLAHTTKHPGNTTTNPRTLDQRRADLLLPALLQRTGTPAPAAPAHINVTVSINTLLGLSHQPGHLHGHGPICAEQTRRIAHAHTAQWRFLLTATDGTLVDTSARTYTPGAALRRLTQLKHTTCAFPHCRMPADRCDLDHGLPFHQGGPTTADNLAPLCRRHHNGKSFGHWKLDRHGDTITWTSQHTGRTYTTTPTRYPTAAD